LARAVPPRGSGGSLLGVGHLQNPHRFRVALSCWFVSPGPNRVHNVANGEGRHRPQDRSVQDRSLEPERHHGWPVRATQLEQRIMSPLRGGARRHDFDATWHDSSATLYRTTRAPFSQNRGLARCSGVWRISEFGASAALGCSGSMGHLPVRHGRRGPSGRRPLHPKDVFLTPQGYRRLADTGITQPVGPLGRNPEPKLGVVSIRSAADSATGL
jgi:hypothetical protein